MGRSTAKSVNDRRSGQEYLEWCQEWIDECIRVLKPGGSFFLYNIPKWNIHLANFLLDRRMHFRDWITVDIKLGLPIPDVFTQATIACSISQRENKKPSITSASQSRRADTVAGK